MNEAQMEAYMQGLQEKQRLAVEAARDAVARGVTPEIEYLVFSVGGEEYAVPIRKVRGVLALPPATPVPFMPEYYRGVINMRGQILSVVDLRVKLGTEASVTVETAVVVLESGDHALGVVVDSINRVLTVKTVDEVKPAQSLDVDALLNGGKI